MRIDKDFARDIIRCIDRFMSADGNFSTMPDTFLSQPELEKYQYSTDVLDRHLNYCNKQGYFCEFQHYIIGFGLRDISQKGYDFLDGKEDSNMHNSTFNFNNATFNNSSVGENITQSTVYGSIYGDHTSVDQSITNNIGASLDEIEKLIAAKSAADQEQLVGLIELLRSNSAKDTPVQKGLLAKFSDGIKKHSDLIAAIGNWAIAILTAGQ